MQASALKLASLKIKLSDITVVYINLDEDTGKRRKIESMLNKYRFKEVIRLSATKAETFIQGCTTSHARALEIAHQLGGPVLILEDDVIELNGLPEELEIPDSADAIYLGVYAIGISEIHGSSQKWTVGPSQIQTAPVSDGIYRVVSMLAAHAILYITDDYKKFAHRACGRALEILVPHDILFSLGQTFYNVLVYDTPFFAQTSSLFHSIGTLSKKR
jgi:GR25 family glycosyltransferase involved in LPS biosynthesis